MFSKMFKSKIRMLKAAHVINQALGSYHNVDDTPQIVRTRLETLIDFDISACEKDNYLEPIMNPKRQGTKNVLANLANASDTWTHTHHAHWLLSGYLDRFMPRYQVKPESALIHIHASAYLAHMSVDLSSWSIIDKREANTFLDSLVS